ncbi:MAG: sensor histidine kinase [Gammaproteobacteria bacterium]|nr:sensor histidine kinase [Gammaproteobacteria bacterium]
MRFFEKDESLQKQIFKALLLSLLAILSVFWWLSQSTIHTITEDYLLTRLSHDTDTIERNLHLEDGQWVLAMEGIASIYKTVHSGHYFVIKTPNQTILSPSLSGYPLYSLPQNPVDIEALEGRRNVHFKTYETRGPVEDSVLVRYTELRKNNLPIKIYVAEDHTPIQTLLFKFDVLFALFTLLTLISLYFLNKGLIKRAFRQLNPLEDQLREFKLGHKVSIEPKAFPQEVRVLIESLNLALDQSLLQFEKSRQLNANLSHSLKTPLNLIFQLLDAPELQQNPDLQKNLKQQSENMLALIERELKKDRIASLQTIEPLALDELLADLLMTFKQLYHEKNIQFTVDIMPGAQLSMEREDGFELLGNLIDNACKWCESSVSIRYENQQLIIEDDGPGVSTAQLELLQERGYRTDETKPGHGIGLSIVQALVVAYQAEIHFEDSTMGGLKVVVQLAD